MSLFPNCVPDTSSSSLPFNTLLPKASSTNVSRETRSPSDQAADHRSSSLLAITTKFAQPGEGGAGRHGACVTMFHVKHRRQPLGRATAHATAGATVPRDEQGVRHNPSRRTFRARAERGPSHHVPGHPSPGSGRVLTGRRAGPSRNDLARTEGEWGPEPMFHVKRRSPQPRADRNVSRETSEQGTLSRNAGAARVRRRRLALFDQELVRRSGADPRSPA